MERMKSPCFHCPEKYERCHSTCEKYKAYQRTCAQQREDAARRRKVSDDMWALRQSRFRRRHKNRRETKEDEPRG